MSADEAKDEDTLNWKGENWSIVGPTWPGFKKIEWLLVFGDSYSQTCQSVQPAPTVRNPLGVPMPGETYTEGPPNWVGYLVDGRQPPLLVYNYAKGGQTVAGVHNQVTRAMEKDRESMSWTASNSLFVTWVGINDLAFTTEPQASIDTLFETQQELYKTGARNFCFIDVPPINLSPAYKQAHIPDAASRFYKWNIALNAAIKSFVQEKETAGDPITAIYFSSHKLFTELLTLPDRFGFTEKDVKKRGGRVWMDHLHPTSEVHFTVAADIESLLDGVLAASEADVKNK